MKTKRNYYWGKSKCCRAEVDYQGGGWDGEDIVPVTYICTGCGKVSPKIIQRVGRPDKSIF